MFSICFNSNQTLASGIAKLLSVLNQCSTLVIGTFNVLDISLLLIPTSCLLILNNSDNSSLLTSYFLTLTISLYPFTAIFGCLSPPCMVFNVGLTLFTLWTLSRSLKSYIFNLPPKSLSNVNFLVFSSDK